jgi:hypothetical protein
MTRDALLKVRVLLADVDDVIYGDVNLPGATRREYSTDEMNLAKTIDKAHEQVRDMLALLRTQEAKT